MGVPVGGAVGSGEGEGDAVREPVGVGGQEADGEADGGGVHETVGVPPSSSPPQAAENMAVIVSAARSRTITLSVRVPERLGADSSHGDGIADADRALRQDVASQAPPVHQRLQRTRVPDQSSHVLAWLA